MLFSILYLFTIHIEEAFKEFFYIFSSDQGTNWCDCDRKKERNSHENLRANLPLIREGRNNRFLSNSPSKTIGRIIVVPVLNTHVGNQRLVHPQPELVRVHHLTNKRRLKLILIFTTEGQCCGTGTVGTGTFAVWNRNRKRNLSKSGNRNRN